MMDRRCLITTYRLVFICFYALVSAPACLADAQELILLIRHAEQQLGVEDPPLSETGRRRASALAALLKDAGINAIYESGIRRTKETAKPLADILNIEPKTYPRADITGFIAELRSQQAWDRVLIVTQSLRISRWLKAFGHPGEITVAPRDYDNIFVITPKGEGAPLILRLHYQPEVSP